MLRDLAAALREEARSVNERRLLVLAGDADGAYGDVATVLDAADLDPASTTLVAPEDVETGSLTVERVTPRGAGELLGATREAVVYDAREECRPNAIGRVAGAVDGGGLLVFLTPPLDAWPERRDRFDEGMAVPPFSLADVTGHFRERLVETLRAHRGVAVVDRDADGGGAVVDDGLTHPAPRLASSDRRAPAEHAFPRAAYDACRTADQVDAVRAFEGLREPGHALVVEADRGRGKSSAAGIAAACLAAEGRDVLVTAPQYRSAAEAFARAREVLADLDALVGADSLGDHPHELRAESGGGLRFARPPEAAALPGDPDAVIVDEAAALPVRLLDAFLEAPRAAFATTVHGYEGAGRGFDIRFRDHLADSDFAVHEVSLEEPIRYAAGDPVEVWAFRALLLDARPPVDALVDEAAPDSVAFDRLDPDALCADEHLLREAFGLLVAAHYRTEPNDLARLLDAPNLSAVALRQGGTGGHVVSVAMLAREGGLDADTCARMYEGERVKGNMIPDVLTSQLRDESAADPVGFRVVRIATHHAARSRGLGSRLLEDCRESVAAAAGADWIGVGYGATPELLSFWSRNGFSTVHLSTTRNDASGEYSAVMLAPITPAGERLHDRHAEWFADRVGGVLGDALDDLDPDVARAALAACDADADLDLSPQQWRVVADAAYGPGLYSVDPDPFGRLVVVGLVRAGDDAPALSERRQRLLVRGLLQHRPWDDVADALDYHSAGRAMSDLGEALQPLVDAYGDEGALAERERFSENGGDGD